MALVKWAMLLDAGGNQELVGDSLWRGRYSYHGKRDSYKCSFLPEMEGLVLRGHRGR